MSIDPLMFFAFLDKTSPDYNTGSKKDLNDNDYLYTYATKYIEGFGNTTIFPNEDDYVSRYGIIIMRCKQESGNALGGNNWSVYIPFRNDNYECVYDIWGFYIDFKIIPETYYVIDIDTTVQNEFPEHNEYRGSVSQSHWSTTMTYYTPSVRASTTNANHFNGYVRLYFGVNSSVTGKTSYIYLKNKDGIIYSTLTVKYGDIITIPVFTQIIPDGKYFTYWNLRYYSNNVYISYFIQNDIYTINHIVSTLLEPVFSNISGGLIDYSSPVYYTFTSSNLNKPSLPPLNYKAKYIIYSFNIIASSLLNPSLSYNYIIATNLFSHWPWWTGFGFINANIYFNDNRLTYNNGDTYKVYYTHVSTYDNIEVWTYNTEYTYKVLHNGAVKTSSLNQNYISTNDNTIFENFTVPLHKIDAYRLDNGSRIPQGEMPGRTSSVDLNSNNLRWMKIGNTAGLLVSFNLRKSGEDIPINVNIRVRYNTTTTPNDSITTIVTYGSDYYITKSPTKTGFYLKGYKFHNNSYIDPISRVRIFSFSALNETDIYYIDAIWITYYSATINYDLNGGTMISGSFFPAITPSNIIIYENFSKIIYLPSLPTSNNPTYSGYNFVGYNIYNYKTDVNDLVNSIKIYKLKNSVATIHPPSSMSSATLTVGNTTYTITGNVNNPSWPWYYSYIASKYEGGHGDTANSYNISTGQYIKSIYASEIDFKGEYVEMNLSGTNKYLCPSYIKIEIRTNFLSRAPYTYKLYGKLNTGSWVTLIYEPSAVYSGNYHTSKTIEYIGAISTYTDFRLSVNKIVGGNDNAYVLNFYGVYIYGKIYNTATPSVSTDFDFSYHQSYLKLFETVPTANSTISLKAVWDPIPYTLSYSKGDQTTSTGGPTSSGIFYVNKAFTFSSVAYILDGYTHINWNVDSTNYTLGHSGVFLTFGNKTAVAIWNTDSRIITYNASSLFTNSINYIPSPQTYSNAYILQLRKTNVIYINGYYTDGWTKTDRYNIPVTIPNDFLDSSNTIININLYPIWKEVDYITILYNSKIIYSQVSSLNNNNICIIPKLLKFNYNTTLLINDTPQEYIQTLNVDDESTTIKKYPPVAMSSTGGLTTSFTQTLTSTYGTGDYTISASSYYGNPCYQSLYFNGNTSSSEVGGSSASSKYTQPNGYTTSTSFILEDFKGEWIKIKMPQRIYLSYLKIYQRDIISRSPGNYKVYGSINDLNWTELIYTSNASYTSKVHTSAKIDLSTIEAYDTFGLVTNKLVGGDVNATMLNFNELEFYGREYINYNITYQSTQIKPFVSLNSFNTFNNLITGGISNTKIALDIFLSLYEKKSLNALKNTEQIDINTKQIIAKSPTNAIINIDSNSCYTFTDINVAGSTIQFTDTTLCEILVVGGGGGGGGGIGGGGGGGAVIHIPSAILIAGTYTVRIGDGGAAGTRESSASGNGGNTTITLPDGSTIIAEGGGGVSAGHSTGVGKVGGSGGGGAAPNSVLNTGGNPGTSSSTSIFSGYIYGNKGGSITAVRPGNTGVTNACGGGGAGTPAEDIIPNSSTIRGHGGDGIQININGSNYYWGGGGGGGSYAVTANSGARGGKGGGGGGSHVGTGGTNGISNGSSGTATVGGAGGANTGGGGGGGTWQIVAGGKGGSGIVIIKILENFKIKKYESGLIRKYYSYYSGDSENWFDDKTILENTIVTTTETPVFYTRNSYLFIGYLKHDIDFLDFKIYTYTDDASYLWIGGNAISGYSTTNAHAKNGNIHANRYSTNSLWVQLKKGVYYPLRYQYGGDGSYNRSANLSYITKSSSEKITVPGSWYYHEIE